VSLRSARSQHSAVGFPYINIFLIVLLLTRLLQDVCDKVGSSDTGAKDAVAAMIKRLAHRNANVQLYTLELANALSQNCGIQMHKELASRSFTDAMLRLANDRNTHQAVKAKILERMAEWTDMFARDPDLGIMEGAYMKLKSQSEF
jgi:signal transducing adaptor molecule